MASRRCSKRPRVRRSRDAVFNQRHAGQTRRSGQLFADRAHDVRGLRQVRSTRMEPTASRRATLSPAPSTTRGATCVLVVIDEAVYDDRRRIVTARKVHAQGEAGTDTSHIRPCRIQERIVTELRRAAARCYRGH